MKTYFKSSELPHQWAHQLAPQGRCPSHESFNGVAYLSYGTEIGRIIERNGKGKAYLLNVTNYSVTTTSHQHGLRRAIPSNALVFEIGDIAMGCSLSFGKRTGSMVFDYAIEQAAKTATTAKRARQNRAWYLAAQATWLEKAKRVNEYFGLRRKVDDKAVARLSDRIDTERKRQAKAERERQARIEKENAEKIEAWLRGKQASFPYSVSKCYLRTAPDAMMETSRGVMVPIADAERAFRFVIARRTKGWRRNGEEFKIGEFQLDSVNEHGVVAGCHHVTWDEIERFAKLQGWM